MFFNDNETAIKSTVVRKYDSVRILLFDLQGPRDQKVDQHVLLLALVRGSRNSPPDIPLQQGCIPRCQLRMASGRAAVARDS